MPGISVDFIGWFSTGWFSEDVVEIFMFIL